MRIPIIPLSAAAAIVLAATPGADAEVTYRYYASTVNYGYKVIHMPDFDQRRLDTPTVDGLPNDGAMYCAPTSVMNICAYIADHGYPTVPPQDYNWLNPGNYDVATGSLFILGLLSGTSPTGGTGGGGWLAGAEAWVPLDLFTVQAFYRTNSWWPRRWDLAQSVHNGGLVALCYGFYDIEDMQGGIPVVVRDGGHCITLTGMLSGTTPHAFINVRDPADDPANTTQSPFMSRTFYTETKLVFENGLLRAVDNLANDPGDPIRRIFDGYIQVRPKAGVTWSEPAQQFIYVQAAALHGSFFSISPIPSPPGPVSEWTMGPALNRIYALVDLGFGEQLLYCYPLDGGEPMDLDTWSFEPHDMVISNRNVLYLAQESQVRSFDLSVYPPDPIHQVDLSGPATALAFDDAGQKVHVYNAELFGFQTFDAMLEEEQMFTPLPPGAVVKESISLAYQPRFDTLWMVANGEPVAWSIPLDGGDGQAHALPGAGLVTSIDVDDQGHLFVTDQGVLREYRPTELGGFVPHAGPLAGMATGDRIYITKCRTNFDPGEHGKGWHNVLPEETDLGTPVPDCLADLDESGAVDFTDLVAMLAAWGPCPADADCRADLDGDDLVGFTDLLALLAAWGPC